MTSNGRPPGSRIISIYDYPEHLNPFYEDDNHNKIRFWTVGRKKTRSNSFSLSGIRNAMTMRSFRSKKDLKASQSEQPAATLRTTSPHLARSTQSISVMEERSPTRYVYSGSVTPTPLPRLHARSDAALGNQSDSRLSINNGLEEPGRPPRAHRKKRRAPPPPVSVEQVTNNVPDLDVKPDDEALKVVLKIEEDTKDSVHHDERTNKLVAANITEEQKEEIVPTVELKIIEDPAEHPQKESTKTVSDISLSVEKGEKIGQQDKSPIALEGKTADLQITEEENVPKVTRDEEDSEIPATTNITEVTISVNEETIEECNEDSPKPRVSVSSAEIMVSDTTEGVKTPTPKARKISPSANNNANIETNGQRENALKIEEIAPGTSGDDYERDMEAKLLADMEELDKSTHEIKEWLEELNDPAEHSTPAPDKDDTNNNHVPTPPSVLYRSISTISEGKHRSEISNVQLNPSQEDSPNHN